MRKIAIIFSILAIAGCKQGQKQSCALVSNSPKLHTEEASPTESNDIPDSLYISHHWNDRGYLFGSPSDIQLSEWKSQCEETSEGTYEKWEIELFQSNDHLIAVKDLLGVVIQRKELLDGYVDFSLWRLSDYMPVDNVPDSEFSRFEMLEAQIDTLMDYEAGSQYDCNCQTELALRLEEAETSIMYRRLLKKADKELAIMLKAEDDAYRRYHDIQHACYDTVKMEPVFSGSASPMAYNGMSKDDVFLRRKSLEAFYFYLADGRSVLNKLEQHTEIPLSMIEEEYSLFISELPPDENVEDPIYAMYHPLESRKHSLAEERQAFLEWIAEREKISGSLSGDIKRFYDQATNNARRHKLLMLKNRYEGYRIGTADYFDALLTPECSDKQLLDFHI